jgi:uncharacterized protein (TIGR02300 family)
VAIGSRNSSPSKEKNVAKPEWGTKRLCTSCGARFYDLNRQPIECPKCQTVIDPEQVTRLKRSRSAPPEEAAKAKPAKAEKTPDDASTDDDDLDVDVDDDADDDVLEDASDLADDDDDLDELVEGVDPDKAKDGD